LLTTSSISPGEMLKQLKYARTAPSRFRARAPLSEDSNDLFIDEFLNAARPRFPAINVFGHGRFQCQTTVQGGFEICEVLEASCTASNL
jgi:hypothetical protein